ncbi:MAG TPA: helix-hairpin-helix domain-containing protein [Kofleriaceae bacterium]|jgi:competence ComEA-like helix-hairpin-helix protein
MKNFLRRAAITLSAIAVLVLAMDGHWTTASQAAAETVVSSLPPPPAAPPPPVKKSALVGKININTATQDELRLLPTVGPAKAERIVTWRKKNGAFKRIADIRRVKGFGFKTFKKLEPMLAVSGETTLAAQSSLPVAHPTGNDEP